MTAQIYDGVSVGVVPDDDAVRLVMTDADGAPVEKRFSVVQWWHFVRRAASVGAEVAAYVDGRD